VTQSTHRRFGWIIFKVVSPHYVVPLLRLFLTRNFDIVCRDQISVPHIHPHHENGAYTTETMVAGCLFLLSAIPTTGVNLFSPQRTPAVESVIPTKHLNSSSQGLGLDGAPGIKDLRGVDLNALLAGALQQALPQPPLPQRRWPFPRDLFSLGSSTKSGLL